MKKVVILVLACFFMGSIYGQSKKAGKLIDRYMDVGFGEVYGRKKVLVKWEGIDTIKYCVEGKFSFLKEKHWKKYLAEIEMLTGLTFVKNDNMGQSQIRIYFGDLKSYFETEMIKAPNSILGQFAYWSNRKYNDAKQMRVASFCIASKSIDNPSFGAFYIRKMFLQSLGLLGESNEEISLFYKFFTDTNYKLSKSDKHLVRLHYQPELKAGMTDETVKTTIRKSIDLDALMRIK